MKMQLLGTGLAFLFLISCAEAPVYEPKPVPVTSTSTNQPSQQDKTGTDTAKKDADATKNDTPAATPNPSTDPNPAPAPSPSPSPSASPAPTAPVGVAATGKTLLMATCVNAGCHSAAGNTIDAKTAAALQTAGNNGIAAHTANRATHFTPPAAGAAANNFTHILAYLMSIQGPVMGPNLP
jgi:type V secretory pathway adhesin AidA